MYKLISKILEVEFSAASSDIAIFVKIPLELSIYTCHHAEASEIKFPFIYQEWVVNVLLNNHGFVFLGTADQRFDFLQGLANVDTTPLVAVLPRFEDPGVERYVVLVSDLLKLSLVLRILKNLDGSLNLALRLFV